MINKNLCFIVSPTTATTATTAATTATHTHTLNMYLSEHELNAILQTPYYSQPFNTSFVNYTFYSGRYNANVLIVCFNVQNDLFNETFLQGILLTQAEEHYAMILFSSYLHSSFY